MLLKTIIYFTLKILQQYDNGNYHWRLNQCNLMASTRNAFIILRADNFTSVLYFKKYYFITNIKINTFFFSKLIVIIVNKYHLNKIHKKV